MTEPKYTTGQYGLKGMTAGLDGNTPIVPQSDDSLSPDDVQARIIIQPWYKSRTYLFGGWLDANVWRAAVSFPRDAQIE